MDRYFPDQAKMKKYRDMGFDHHHIIEAWPGCQEDGYIFEKALWQIR